jgi:hypothetical protein
MIECPYCYRVFRQPPEKIGARCPKCKMPLYEDPAKRRKDPEKDFGKCLQHPDTATVAKCSRCDAPVCRSCRTRWHQEVVCPQCVDMSILEDEPSPQEAQLQSKQSWIALGLGIIGWLVAVLGIFPYSQFNSRVGENGYVAFFAYVLFLGSLLPSVFGLSVAIAALRLRGDHRVLALAALATSGAHIGGVIGLIVLNLWHN